MAKSANAEDLKSSDSNILWVQVPLSPLQINNHTKGVVKLNRYKYED